MSDQSDANPEIDSMDRERLGRVFAQFLLLNPENEFSTLEMAIKQRSGRQVDLALTFQKNLRAAVIVGSIPFIMAHAAEVKVRFQSIAIGERIRTLKSEYDGWTEAQKATYVSETSDKRMDEYLMSEGGIRAIRNSTIEHLGRLLDNQDFASATNELLRETLVMIWGALETFISDLVRSLVNEQPSLAVALCTKEPAKKHFPSRGLSVEALAGHSFKIDNSMGDLIFSDIRFDSLPMIKDVLSVLIDDAELHSALNDSRVWTIWQRRHLIVHKRGMVDQAYLSKTGDNLSLGSQLSVTADEVQSALSAILGIGQRIFVALVPVSTQEQKV